MIDIYGGKDPRNIPSYSTGDAARYLNIPQQTIRSWTVGRKYPVNQGEKYFHPLIEVPETKPIALTFTNLVELHILCAIRHHHKIDLGKVRTALDFIDEQFKIPHPLAHQAFQTDGVDLFIEKYGSLINASQQGQLALKEVLKIHLDRIEADKNGVATKIYPFTRSTLENNPKIVVIDLRISFGRLIVADTGIPTAILAERYHAGDSIEELVYDYECDQSKIEEAIRCEMNWKTAA